MLNITTTIAEVVGKRLAATYRHYYGDQEAQFATLLDASARLIIERISTSDALYHNVEPRMPGKGRPFPVELLLYPRQGHEWSGVHVVKLYLRDHETRQYHAPTLVMLALKEKFPCQKRTRRTMP